MGPGTRSLSHAAALPCPAPPRPQPHAGFPEIRYHDMAEGLARAGYRVVCVEQTETPEMLARRNEDRKRQVWGWGGEVGAGRWGWGGAVGVDGEEGRLWRLVCEMRGQLCGGIEG